MADDSQPLSGCLKSLRAKHEADAIGPSDAPVYHYTKQAWNEKKIQILAKKAKKPPGHQETDDEHAKIMKMLQAKGNPIEGWRALTLMTRSSLIRIPAPSTVQGKPRIQYGRLPPRVSKKAARSKAAAAFDQLVAEAEAMFAFGTVSDCPCCGYHEAELIFKQEKHWQADSDPEDSDDTLDDDSDSDSDSDSEPFFFPEDTAMESCEWDPLDDLRRLGMDTDRSEDFSMSDAPELDKRDEAMEVDASNSPELDGCYVDGVEMGV